MQLRPTYTYKTEVMDHHGLVAAISRDLGIAEKINRRIGSQDPRRVVQPGVACVAMIMNGLARIFHEGGNAHVLGYLNCNFLYRLEVTH